MAWIDEIRGIGRSFGDAKPSRANMKTAVSPQPVMLMTFVTVLILMAGSSRFDLPSLILIRPLSMLFLVVAIMQLSPDGWRENRFIIVMMAAIILLPTLQLVPLPPRLWHSLAGRDLVQQIDIAAGIIGAWRPLTLSPLGTENALFSLAVPAAVLFAGFGLDRRQRNALLPFVLSLILASALLGLLQILGPHGGPLYFYRVTHADSAVGFLANRNHHATLVAAAFPILGAARSGEQTAPDRTSGSHRAVGRTEMVHAGGDAARVVFVAGRCLPLVFGSGA